MEANFRLRWLRRWLQQGAELLEDLPQRHIVNQQRFVYLGQASENGRVGGDILAHFDERANDIDAHSDGARAVEYVGGHERAVFGKGVRERATAAIATAEALTVANCDVKESRSSVVSWNRKSWGNRSRLRFTASLRRIGLYAVKPREIGIEDDALVANGMNQAAYVRGKHQLGFAHHAAGDYQGAIALASQF